MTHINNKKDKIRSKMKRLRNELTMDEVLDKSSSIQNLFNLFRSEHSIENYMSYVSIGNEVRTVGIIEKLLEEGKNVSVPLCIPERTGLVASRIYHLDELEPSYFGLLEPKKEFIRPVEPQAIEMILIPGLAFDRKGNRLGLGKGYYDRFLTRLSANVLKIGLAYRFQIIEEVPIGSWDVPLDIIITDKEIITY
ncbi:MAG: 5-formyltetrahydrofolate cyclo-ligase [Clostridiales bacterium]|nr:5-formyltetrahydrofolate cyclo-ligase [Clostridiales bacterium]